MSNDFDREAEREKLREKFERDKEKREASERMSELLLQGATMTNRHCPECHSPVFRYDGSEFCPTCQREVVEVDDEAASGDGDPSAVEVDDASDDGDVETTTSSDRAGTAVSSPDGTEDAIRRGPPEEDDTDRRADRIDDPGDARSGTESDSRHARDETPRTPADGHRPARVDSPARRESVDGHRGFPPSEGGGLDEAEATLVREITDLVRRAEQTRDVARKRDLFAAARDAGETLQTIRRL